MGLYRGIESGMQVEFIGKNEKKKNSLGRRKREKKKTEK